jgi:HK97 family phage major capsid protein
MKEYLKKLIKRLKKQQTETQERADASESAVEVRELGATLLTLAEEIADAEAQLAELESNEGDGEQKGNDEDGGDARGLTMSKLYGGRRSFTLGNGASTGSRVLTLGEHVVRHIKDKMPTDHVRFSLAAPEWRSSTDPQTTGGASGSLADLLTEIDTNIVRAYRRPTLSSLFNWGAMTKSMIAYFVEGAREGNIATVAEGGQKPQVHYVNPTKVVEALTKIAGFIKISDEMLDDLPFLVSEINGRLLYDLSLIEEAQLLYGNGASPNLVGLMNRSGLQTYTSTDFEKNADAIFHAKTLIANATGLVADGIVLNPTDYEAFRLSRDVNGQYYGGGYFTGPYGNGASESEPNLWGVRTVASPAITAGTVLVGSFAQAATPYRKGGVTVESTNSNEDDFTNNLVTVRAEERIALAVRIPAGFVKVTLAEVE